MPWTAYTHRCFYMKTKVQTLTLPGANTAGHILNGLSFLLQLLSHVLQVLPVVPVRILQKLVAKHRVYSKLFHSTFRTVFSLFVNRTRCFYYWRREHYTNKLCILVILVLKQLTVATSESVTCLTKQLEWLLLVDVTKHGLLCGSTYSFWCREQEEYQLK